MNHPDSIRIDLYRSGRFHEFLASCLPFKAKLSAQIRAMAAEAAFYCGDTDMALELVSFDDDDASVHCARPRLEAIRGLLARASGSFDSALRHFNLAVRLATEKSELIDVAWCELRRFRALVDGLWGSESVANLSNVRRSVSAAGNPHLTASLHDIVAIMEGQAGRYDEARRHLDIAQSILAQHPHAWIEFSVHNHAFCVAWLACDYASAAKHLKRARRAGALVGGTHKDDIVDVNGAHIALLTGDLHAAHTTLSRLLSRPRSLEHISAIDGLGRLYLALGQYQRCGNVLAQSWIVNRSHMDAYQVRCLCLSRVTLAMRCGRFREAVEFVESELHGSRARLHHPFLKSLLLLQAEALVALGDATAASRAFLKAAETDVMSPAHEQGEAYWTTSKILGGVGISYAPLLAARARRLWRREQNIWAQLAAADHKESERPVARYTQGDVDRLAPETDIGAPSHPREATNTVLNCVIGVFEQSFDVALAAAEFKVIAETTGCSDQVSFRTAALPRNAADEDTCTARLTGERGDELVVRCTPSADLGRTVAAANLIALVRRVDELARLRREERRRAALWPTVYEESSEDLFISEEMTVLAATGRKIAPTSVPVLITGETGTGKEILARAIHAASARSKRSFVPFNCSAGPRDMIDAQLFGHRRGAFTGATEHAPGVIRATAGGTLFLDEIGEAPVEVQPKLLRFLESGEIHPIGEPLPSKVDVRVIAATNVDLEAAVSSGLFREDLFYRLNIVRLHLPPLRERRVEIPVFAQHYLRKYAAESGKGDLRLAEETVEYLLLYRWPGNVRQLANEIRRMAALAEVDAVLMPEHLSPDIGASRRTVPASERTLDPNELIVRLDQPLAAATEHLERVMIPHALRQSDGRVEEAAHKLGLSRKGLYLKRLRLRLDAAGPQQQTA